MVLLLSPSIMSNTRRYKTDTPAFNTNVSTVYKVVTLDDIWSLLSSIEVKVNSNDSNLKYITSKLKIFESNFINIKKSLNNLSLELIHVKKNNSVLTSDIRSCIHYERELFIWRIHMSNHLLEFDITKEFSERLLKKKN